MHRVIIPLTLILLSACVPGRQAQSPSAPLPEPPAKIQPLPLEQVPEELSVEYFSRMRLVGSGLTLTSIERGDAYTRYAADYWSNGLRISGIMNIPHGEGPFPLLMLNHGYIHPSVYTRGRGLKREQDYLARNGFAVFHSDYRGHGESDASPDTRKIYDAGLEYSMDVVNAISAIRAAELPTVDTARIGMLGHSMGGGIALNIAVAYPALVQALVLYAPVNSDAWENFARWRAERDDDDRTAEVLRSREENPAAWDLLSSKTLLSRLQVPVLLFQGDRDADVPKSWSDGLTSDLKRIGKDITYVEYSGEGHEFVRQWPDFMEQTKKFFDGSLR